MEKIRINGNTFDLIPMGISQSEKKRSFTIIADSDIETAFANVGKIEHLSEGGEVLATYLDGVAVKSISKDLESGTYTVTIGTDAIERELARLQKYTDDAICELTILTAMMGGF